MEREREELVKLLATPCAVETLARVRRMSLHFAVSCTLTLSMRDVELLVLGSRKVRAHRQIIFDREPTVPWRVKHLSTQLERLNERNFRRQAVEGNIQNLLGKDPTRI